MPRDRAMQDAATSMLNWLVGDCKLFGVAGQNWMLVVGGGLLLCIAVLVIAQRRQTRMR
jgi:LPXTG-motif cell wall-anchored protein